MQDILIREIERLGQMIAAILERVGGMRRSGSGEPVLPVVKTELADRLDMDLDTLLEEDDPADVLVSRYGFDTGNLEKFAELLFDVTVASDDTSERRRLAAGIRNIYGYLEHNTNSASLYRYEILRELQDYE